MATGRREKTLTPSSRDAVPQLRDAAAQPVLSASLPPVVDPSPARYPILAQLPAADDHRRIIRAGFGPRENVGNIVGANPRSFDDGIRAVYELMIRHITGNHRNWKNDPRTTIAGIAPRYCTTNTQDWIDSVSRLSGIRPDAPLSVHDRPQMMAFVAAVIAKERGSMAVHGHAFSTTTLARNYTAALHTQSTQFASIRAMRPAI